MTRWMLSTLSSSLWVSPDLPTAGAAPDTNSCFAGERIYSAMTSFAIFGDLAGAVHDIDTVLVLPIM